MSMFMIAFLFGLGVGAWIYNRFYSRTGGNQKNALIAAVACGATTILVLYMLLSLIPE